MSALTTTTKRTLAIAVAVTAMVLGGAMLTLSATAASSAELGDQVCPALDSGKIDTPSNPTTLTITAPAGMLIDAYCVKAGSANSGDGPVIVQVNPPQASVTISYPGGKEISHYSVSYTTTTTTTPTTATTETTETTTPTTETTPTTATTETTSTAPTTATTTSTAPTTAATTVSPSEATSPAQESPSVKGEQAEQPQVPGAVAAGYGPANGSGSGGTTLMGVAGLLMAVAGAGLLGTALARKRA